MEHPLVQIGGIFIIRNIPKIVLAVTIFIALKSSIQKFIANSSPGETNYGWNILG